MDIKPFYPSPRNDRDCLKDAGSFMSSHTSFDLRDSMHFKKIS